MKNFSLITPVCLFVLCAGPAMAQQDFSKVEIKATHVRGNIYMLNGTGGNVGASIGADGVLIVDDKFAPLADKIRAALSDIGGGKLEFILNTHFHGDHVGGNQAFGPEAPIIAHTNVRKRLMREPKEAWPVITFDESLSVHFNGEEIKAIHFPHGHTDGDTVIFFTGSNVVHMGDDFFYERFPFVDLKSGGDVEGLTKNIEAVIRQVPADAKIIPGHGPLSTPNDLKHYHRMLGETTEIIRQRMAAGKDLHQIKTEGLPEKWKPWATGFISTERWIETIHRSLSRKSSNQ